MSEWQPIETAPKDGTDVLLVINGKVHLGAWVDNVHTINGKVTYESHEWATPILWMTKGPEPTHWMPIPKVPA